MKEVMDRYSVRSFDGVPLFEIPQADFGQQSLFDNPLPPVDLAQELLRRFSGQTLTRCIGPWPFGTAESSVGMGL